MFVYRTHGVAAAALGALAMGACDDPALNTDLRPEGPPDVLAVLVMTDASTQLLEKATYCKAGDPLAPTLVGLPDFTTTEVCPESGSASPVTTAYPDGWYVRIMFDELLDPSFEQLSPIIDEDTGEETGAFTGSIASANPVTLQCRSVTNNQFVNVSYDGYYSPSGNRVTWPVGPSLVIKPNDPTLIATNTECQVTINEGVLFDKNGVEVPSSQRGPFAFTIAPITPIVLDPPADDEEFDDPIDAVTVWYDNLYVQFNTSVDASTLCLDPAGNGYCANDSVFAIKDVEHPAEGPGYCDVSGETCGTLADCMAKAPGGGDTLCGKGYCMSNTDSDDSSFSPCNTAADCTTPDDACGTSYVYDYIAYGGTDTEFGIGPANPVQTDRKYTFNFIEGAKLKDRCGRESTFAAPDAGDLTLARFITEKFDLNSTTIVTGEVASAMKRLQFNFNNVVEGADSYTASDALAAQVAIDTTSATPAFTVTPLPKVLTAPCPGGGAACSTADIALDDLLIQSYAYDGQIQMAGHLMMNTEYTATLKAGTVVKDFYGATWTNDTAEDMVIKWKTQPAIQMTGIAVRNSDWAVSTGNNGTLDKTGAAIDIRISFNASIDPTTFDAADFKVEPAVAGLDFTPARASGCGGPGNLNGWLPACTLRARAPAENWKAGTYKITFLKDAKVKDIFGVEYTHAADTTITVDIAETAAAKQCL
jgi:hypothetical protein